METKSDESTMVHIPDVLNATECLDLIRKANDLLIDCEDDNGLDRVREKNPQLASMIESRLKQNLQSLPWVSTENAVQDSYLHCQWFYTRYENGGQIGPHIDGSRYDGEYTSVATIILYLNDDFDGGHTCSAKWEVVPKTGSALILKQNVKHWGLPVQNGQKFILRSDWMMRKSKEGLNDINSFYD